jgi:hypothetical protein
MFQFGYIQYLSYLYWLLYVVWVLLFNQEHKIRSYDATYIDKTLVTLLIKAKALSLCAKLRLVFCYYHGSHVYPVTSTH